ncbi:hypothetical protein B5M09_011283 [Aphanomyces astaci]|uniref:Prolyl endopeptidase n=1 Tax=Aphanomyces astaci TaxID=112090 RepID=A0A425CRQ6_APHAT|nr:hypothetical protein B5M09_011283 [Aphanomyces astaci]
MTPPVLEKRPQNVPFGKVPGENRGKQPMEPIIYLEDPYYYVRDDTRTNTEILDHLRAENAYTKAALSHLDSLQDELYKELLSHVQETDQTAPYPHGDFVYYTRTEEGKAYGIHYRKPRHDDGAEKILLDVNKLAEGHAYCGVRSVEVSPDHKLLAYSVDFMAYQTYDIYIKDLTTNTINRAVEGCDGTIVWGRDAETLFYVTQDAAHRSHKVWSHLIGAPQSDNTSLFTEDDEMLFADLLKTSSGRFLVIHSSSEETSEVRVLDLHDPQPSLAVVAPRGVQYTVEHWQNELLISTNRDGDVNFKLMSVPLHIVLDKQKAAQNSQWTPVFSYDPTVKVESVICFESFFVLNGRQDSLTQRWICGRDSNNSTWHRTRLNMPETIYSLGTAKNVEYATTKFRYTYSSLTTPVQTVEYDFISNKTVILKETPVPYYDRERVEATASDGTTIPMSVIYRKDKKKAEGNPQALHLYGYEAAKYLTKMTTFTDFIACAEHLVATKVTSPSHMTCEGSSAGGLLIGAVLNMRPDLFIAVHFRFPLCHVQVAKLRDLKTDNNQVLLKMDLDGGHMSVSERYQLLKKKAVELSFLLDQLKCHEK